MLDVELAAHNAWRIVCPNIPQVLPVFIQAAIKLHILTVYLSGGCFFLHKQFGETFNVVDWERRIGPIRNFKIDLHLFWHYPHVLIYDVYDVRNFWLEQVIGNTPVKTWPTTQQVVADVATFCINDTSVTFPIPVWNHFATQRLRSTYHWNRGTKHYKYNMHNPKNICQHCDIEKKD